MSRPQQRPFTVERRGTNPSVAKQKASSLEDQSVLADQIDGMLSAIERLENRVTAIAEVLPENLNTDDDRAAPQPVTAGADAAPLPHADWQDIADELTQVVQTTERATEDILDASEAIDSIAGELIDLVVDDPEQGEAVELIQRVRQLTGQIFQAASFQDLTGQRINKVTKIVQTINARVEHLEQSLHHDKSGTGQPSAAVSGLVSSGGGSSGVVSSGGADGDDLGQPGQALDPNDPHFNETSLLNGPSKSGEGISQEEIDQLF